ncbi:unnamed protein product [Paramecium octaurelia]|uniref:Translation initiation factor 3 N-terminal domain-containing protein n=1 Tax=Paramecium octaurelia TaxID=43137 RepID=A0A8S1UVQ4_PAROT|nr:unnamed protein product [Paramecium octaurelia]
MILKYCFGIYKFNPIIIQRVSALLKVKPYPVNENIQYQGEVRVIDDKYKLLGVMPFQQAKEQATKEEKEIILMNENVEPPLCRICDYSDELAQRFLTEISPPFKKLQPQRNIKIGSKITFQDLQIKVIAAQTILKKQKRIIVSTVCFENEVLICKNIFYKFRDMCEQFMKPLGSIRSREYQDTSEQYRSKDEEKQPQIELEYEFEKIGEIEQPQAIPQLKIERQINQTYSLTTRQELLNADEAIKEFNQQYKDIDKEEGEINEEDLTNEKIWPKQKIKRKITKYTYPKKDIDTIMMEKEKVEKGEKV